MLILTAFHLFTPLRKRPHHLVCRPGTRGAATTPVDLTLVASNCPHLTVPGHPGAEAGGLLCLGPGLRAASSSRNPNCAVCDPNSAFHRGPLLAPRSSNSISSSPRLGTFRDDGADAALGSLPRSPAPRRTQQAAGTAPRNAGLRGWPWRPGTATGSDGQAPPEQGAGDHQRA